jgi:hypothetical protein
VWANHVSHSQPRVPARRWKGARVGGPGIPTFRGVLSRLVQYWSTSTSTRFPFHTKIGNPSRHRVLLILTSSPPTLANHRLPAAAPPAAVVAASPGLDLSLSIYLSRVQEWTIGITRSWPIRRWTLWLLAMYSCRST